MAQLRDADLQDPAIAKKSMAQAESDLHSGLK